MSAVEELLAQYRQKAQISKSRKRPRETITADLVAERTTKNKTENTSEQHFDSFEEKNFGGEKNSGGVR